MLLLNEDTTWNAREKLLDMYEKPRASKLGEHEVAVTCENPTHPEGHVCRFERRASGDLYGECAVRHTGELCPAGLSKLVCYHLAAGAFYFVNFVESYDLEGQTELAVMEDAPLPPPLKDERGRRIVYCHPGFSMSDEKLDAENVYRKSIGLAPIVYVAREAA